MLSDIHVISENDLQKIKKIGKRMRACCPIHHSRDRDLSIAPALDYYLDDEEEQHAGFGYCHSANCNAVVLVKEWNPKAATRILGQPVKASVPRHRMTSEEIEQAEEWQRQELAALHKIYPSAAQQLRHMRAYAYLAQRGLGSQDALDLLSSLGVAYIPPAEEWKKEPPAVIRRWCDRILFPFSCANTESGYIARTLHLWQPGMDENEHKRLLKEHDERMEQEHGKDAKKYQVARWLKTYKSGFFNAVTMREHEHLYICEGAFDAIPLMLAGLPGVVAIAGTHLNVPVIPKNVFDVTLAFDADMEGKDAIAKTMDLLGGAGITPVFCIPPHDGLGKDWSERYRLNGVNGLSVLIDAERQRQESTVEPDLAELDSLFQLDPDAVPEKCAACGVVMPNQYSEEEAKDATDFYYIIEDDGVFCYCAQCYDADSDTLRTSTPAHVEDSASSGQPHERAEHEQFMRVVNDISQIFGGGTITVDPPGYTLAEHVKRLQLEEAQRIRDAQSRVFARRG